MTVDVLASIVSAGVIGTIVALIAKKRELGKEKGLKKSVKLISLLIVGGILWYFTTALLFLRPIANLFPNMKGAHCFLLDVGNCSQREDCFMGIGTPPKAGMVCLNK